MRTILASLGAAAALGAAVIWTPFPSSNPQDGSGPKAAHARSPAMIAPGDITASPAAALIQFGPEATETGESPKPGPPILVGLIRSGPRRIAYVLFAGQTTRAGLWDRVGPWRVTGIGPRGVTLQESGKSLALTLYGPRPAPEPATSAETTAASPPATAPSPPQAHALEPASAPPPQRQAGRRPRYWVGPPGSAPPGYIQLKPGERPPN